MRSSIFTGLVTLCAIVLFSYGSASGQVVDAVKDAAAKAKEVTVDAAKKTTVVVTDGLEKAADKTKDEAVEGSKKAASTSKKVGSYSIDVTEGVVGKTYEGGRYYSVKTWDGTKWVSKQVWYATKKAASGTKNAVVGDGQQKP